MLGRSRRLDRFAVEKGCRLLHLEAPPFVGCKTAKTICSIHDLRSLAPGLINFGSLSSLYLRLFLPLSRNSVSGWLVLSEYGRREVLSRLSLPADLVFVVPPAVQVPKKVKIERLARREKYVLAVGHIEERKNLRVLVEAQQLDSWPSDVELWFAGKDQGDQAQLEKLASTSRKNKVRFLGPVSDNRKWLLIQGALAVAVPSKIEGFGIVAIEAPSLDVPALVSDESALPEISGHQQAVISGNGAEGWAERVAQIEQSPSLRKDIVEAQKSILSRFDTRTVTHALLDAYRIVFQNACEKNRVSL